MTLTQGRRGETDQCDFLLFGRRPNDSQLLTAIGCFTEWQLVFDCVDVVFICLRERHAETTTHISGELLGASTHVCSRMQLPKHVRCRRVVVWDVVKGWVHSKSYPAKPSSGCHGLGLFTVSGLGVQGLGFAAWDGWSPTRPPRRYPLQAQPPHT